MVEPYLSEIRMMSFSFAPQGWASCNGQLLPINQNQALFALLGTNFGGNGYSTFALPDLRGRLPIHVGNGHTLGESGGSGQVTLNSAQALHGHAFEVYGERGTSGRPGAASLPAVANADSYGLGDPVAMDAVTTSVGGSQAHTNLQPYAAVHFCIALQGVFPAQN